ncbi:SatD family protein [uncultured Clostridium sp.]|uniref:SatD family protein n=1 Tax=uncultured Clostridium sp. TaxID=59620 RepID=UPI0025D76ADC|nr:SatD family protein [uncultured Clostridium sp.]
MSRLYSVINMDIMNSRNIKDRESIQNDIKTYLTSISKKYQKILVAPITMTLGDEWQIVLSDISESYDIFKEIQVFLKEKEIKCYGGLGIGSIDTSISSDTREMDGEAFAFAREALKIAKSSTRFYNEYMSAKENRFYFNGIKSYFNEYNSCDSLDEVALTIEEDYVSINDMINILIENNEVLESKITIKQREIIKLYKEYGSYNSIVKEFKNTSKPSISQKLNSSNYFLITHNHKMIKNLLKLYEKRLMEK